MGATQEQNKAVVQRYITETDRGNLEIVFDVMTEDVRWHHPDPKLAYQTGTPSRKASTYAASGSTTPCTPCRRCARSSTPRHRAGFRPRR